MQSTLSCRTALLSSARRTLRATPVLRCAPTLDSRSNSSSAPASTDAPQQRPQSKSSNAALAFAAGSLVSGAVAYWFASQTGRSGSEGAVELNGQYGSQEDFRRAIEELKRLFPDEDTVTDDVEHLEEHGFSENDYHPGEHLLDLTDARVGGGSSGLSGWDGVCRLEAVCGRLPVVDGGCGQDRQDGCQVQDACRCVLGGH